MKLKRLIAVVAAFAAVGGVAAMSQIGDPPKAVASDHDDGELDLKSRALNLTDHFAFTPDGGTNMALVMYFNPRSLPGRQYFLSTNARYEFHLTKVASRTAAVAPKDDIVIRFEAGPPTATGNQFITMTLIRGGTVALQHIGQSATIANARGITTPLTTNTIAFENATIQYYVGQRADSFHFDVNRYFQVRAFLAQLFFGNGGMPDTTATLAPNCNGQTLLQNDVGDLDPINLWNPPSCAPDFTNRLNVTAIVVRIPKAILGAETIYDTWSTISVLQ